METKITAMLARLHELEALLGTPDVFNDQKRYRALTQEHAYLSEVKQVWDSLQRSRAQISDNKEMLSGEKDLEFAAVLREDIQQLESKVEVLQTQLEKLLVPPDPNDNRNTIIEIRAGTGGDEAALFVGDCVRMYKLYADKMGWRYELFRAQSPKLAALRNM